MKKTLILLVAMVVMTPIATKATTPTMISQNLCNIQTNVYKKKYNDAMTIIKGFQALSYDGLSYVDCIWSAMRSENEFSYCDNLYNGYKNDWNFFANLKLLNYRINDAN